MSDAFTAALEAAERAYKLATTWAPEDPNLDPHSEEAQGPRQRVIGWAPVIGALSRLLVVLRSLRSSGSVVVVLSKASIEALHDTRLACLASSTFRVSMEPASALDRLMTALARDLDDVLKEG